MPALTVSVKTLSPAPAPKKAYAFTPEELRQIEKLIPVYTAVRKQLDKIDGYDVKPDAEIRKDVFKLAVVAKQRSINPVKMLNDSIIDMQSDLSRRGVRGRLGHKAQKAFA